MAPYRQPPTAADASNDPPHIKRWLTWRDRFGHLDSDSLWQPPAEQPFKSERIKAFAVSPDGRLALLSTDKVLWSLDTATMVPLSRGPVPGGPQRLALSDDGSVAAMVCDSKLYRWQVGGADEPVAIWNVGRADFLSLDRTGTLAATAAKEGRAVVRVFDLTAGTLVYSFVADCRNGLHMHPDGKHIICVNDSARALIWARDGRQSSYVQDTGGVAISRDGSLMLCSDRNNDRVIRKFRIDARNDRLMWSEPHNISVAFKVEYSGVKLRFSPSGSLAIVEGYDNCAYVVDLTQQTKSQSYGDMTTSDGILANEQCLLGERWYEAYRSSLTVIDFSATPSNVLGALVPARHEDTHVLAGLAAAGFYGVVDGSAERLSDLDDPWERPRTVTAVLARSAAPTLSPDDALYLGEVTARRQIWKSLERPDTTVDVDERQLMQINRGLLHLTPEIVDQALRKAGSVRFGKPQLTLAALHQAREQLRSLDAKASERVFAEMLTRLRGDSAEVTPTPQTEPDLLPGASNMLGGQSVDAWLNEGLTEDD